MWSFLAVGDSVENGNDWLNAGQVVESLTPMIISEGCPQYSLEKKPVMWTNVLMCSNLHRGHASVLS